MNINNNYSINGNDKIRNNLIDEDIDQDENFKNQNYNQTEESLKEIKSNKFDWKLFKRFLNVVKILYMNPVAPLILLAVLFGLGMLQTYISQFTGTILANVYTSLTTGDKELFFTSVGKGFGAIGFSGLLDANIQFVVALMAWNWRKTLCSYIQDIYFKKSLYYKIMAFNDKIDNPDQRITSDIDSFSTSLASIISNCITGPMVVIYYTYLCIKTIDWYAPLLVYGYFFLGYFANKLVMSPMVSINYLQDKLEGDFRYLHLRIRNHSESIALFNVSKNKSMKRNGIADNGNDDECEISADESYEESTGIINRREKKTNKIKNKKLNENLSEEKRKKLEEEILVEETQAKKQFDTLLANKKRLIFWNFGLTSVSDLFTYCASLVNYLIICIPVFALQNGPLTSAQVTIQSYNCIMLASGFSTYINVSSSVSQLSGYVSRICSMLEVCQKVINDDSYDTETTELNEKDNSTIINDEFNKEVSINTSERLIKINQGENIVLNDITYFTPNGNQLFSNISVCVEKGKNLLIMGPSGSGKSSLVRIINGLWPFFKGKINRPDNDKIFFLPQTPYLIFGTLEEQILYPFSKKDKRIPKDKLRELFARLDIDYLIDREQFIKKSAQINDLTHNWLNALSPGEQQLISIIRLFYHQPQYALLDESTSSIPQSLEEKVYQIAKVLNITVISVGHRLSLLKHHDNVLRFDKNKNWFFEEINHSN